MVLSYLSALTALSTVIDALGVCAVESRTTVIAWCDFCRADSWKARIIAKLAAKYRALAFFVNGRVRKSQNLTFAVNQGYPE
jgi:hypothetical protein